MKAAHGFSVIELLVGMILLGALLAIGISGFTDYLRNARVRTSAESVLNGLQLARAEAVRANRRVGFYLVNSLEDGCGVATGGPHWIVSATIPDPIGLCASSPSIVQRRSAGEGSAGTATILAIGPSVPQQGFQAGIFVFNSLGRLITPAPQAPPPVVPLDVSSSLGGACAPAGPVRCLRIEVSPSGQIRMCDPVFPRNVAVAQRDVQACTPP